MDSNIYKDEELTQITIRGAKQHNLKGVNADIPRDKFVVVTGLSGSGKSSLAFDTIYAEGQRRYVECLSPYARQFLDLMKKPDVDTIDGLSPAISIEQKSISHNPRSTVGTVTEIYDYLRLLYAKIGIQYCVDCKVPVIKKSLDQILDEIFTKLPNRKIQILAPIVKARKGHYREVFESLMKQGFTKVRIDGAVENLKEGMQVSRYKVHDIELIVDRTVVEKAQERRIYESIELALNKAEGVMILMYETETGVYADELFSVNYSCPSCGKSYEALAPNMFSFNSPYGACKACEGVGQIFDFNSELILPDKTLSINGGAIAPLGEREESWLWNQVIAYAEAQKIDLDTPIEKISTPMLNSILYGNEEGEIKVSYKFGKSSETSYSQKYLGIIPTMRKRYASGATNAAETRRMEEYMTMEICTECNGGRLKPENLAVLIDGNNITHSTNLDINFCRDFFVELKGKLTDREQTIANLILKEIVSRLEFLNDVGLSYLSLNRSVRTLSGGESQRIRLASQIGSKLVGITYVLDEPSIGLHQHDNDKLIQSLKNLRDLGNTVIVVEHDRAMIEEADYLIDMGPGAGEHGGEIVLAVDNKKLSKLTKKDLTNSLTAQYIKDIKMIELPEKRRPVSDKFIELKGATGNNLKNVTLRIPIGVFTCITGMSGSGKSTLINDTLFPILSRKFFRSITMPLPYESIEGLEYIDKVIEIDQTPIGRTPRSNPATYTGLFTLIRDFFAMMPESKVRGYKAGRFSFNVKSGRCEECEGAGMKKLEMNFLPDVYVMCDVCNGHRYNSETLQVKYKHKSIAEVLDMTVEQALEFFSEIPKIKRKLAALSEVGLSYVTLGQQAPTLSGGEAQRVKLATELSKIGTGKTLYILDEPTTGLHFEDVNILLKLLQKLVAKGNTVVIIEHNLDVIKCADRIIDLGPEGGFAGGRIIAEGTPEEVVKKGKGFTAKYLAEELARHKKL